MVYTSLAATPNTLSSQIREEEEATFLALLHAACGGDKDK